MGSPGPSRRPRVAVTGGAGFIGGNLVDRLVQDGCRVLVIDDLSSGRRDRIHPAADFELRDVAVHDLDGLLRGWRAELVYHLAAQTSVPASQADPMRDLAVNVVGTHRVASAARAVPTSRLVFVSSGGAVYGETRGRATERTLPAPRSYYGIHKLAAEGHVALAGSSFAIARPSNVYGPHQTAGVDGAVVAAFVEQAMTERILRIHGDGSQTRDLVHVSDVVEALVLLGRPGTPDGTWNVASGRSVAVSALAGLIERAIGEELGRAYGPRRPGDVTRSELSAARLRALGWRPAIGLEDGLAGLVGAQRQDGAGPHPVRPVKGGGR